MASLYLLIPISIVLLLAGVGVYFWAVKNGQYDDLDREGERLLFDEDMPDEEDKTEEKEGER